MGLAKNERNEPVKLRDILVTIVPVTANPMRNGHVRLNSLLKNTGHGSNFLILTHDDCVSLSLFKGNAKCEMLRLGMKLAIIS